MSKEDSNVIWTRRVNWEAQRARRNRFLQWFVAPSGAAILIVGVVVGPGEALGLLILISLFGLLLGTWVWAQNLLLRQNAELILDAEGQLALGSGQRRRRFDLARVEAWTTKMGMFRTVTAVPSSSVPVSGSMKTAEVLLRYPVDTPSGERGRRPDGGETFEIKAFFWLEMPEDELDEVRATLEPLIEAPWVPPDRLRD